MAPLLCGAPQDVQAPAVRGLFHPHDPFDLAQFGVGVLQDGRAFDEHVDLDVVADRHLVGEPAEVPLQLGDAGDELVATAVEVDATMPELLGAVRRDGRRRRGRAPRHGGSRGAAVAEPVAEAFSLRLIWPRPRHSSPKKLP